MTVFVTPVRKLKAVSPCGSVPAGSSLRGNSGGSSETCRRVSTALQANVTMGTRRRALATKFHSGAAPPAESAKNQRLPWFSFRVLLISLVCRPRVSKFVLDERGKPSLRRAVRPTGHLALLNPGVSRGLTKLILDTGLRSRLVKSRAEYAGVRRYAFLEQKQQLRRFAITIEFTRPARV